MRTPSPVCRRRSMRAACMGMAGVVLGCTINANRESLSVFTRRRLTLALTILRSPGFSLREPRPSIPQWYIPQWTLYNLVRRKMSLQRRRGVYRTHRSHKNDRFPRTPRTKCYLASRTLLHDEPLHSCKKAVNKGQRRIGSGCGEMLTQHLRFDKRHTVALPPPPCCRCG